MTPLLPVALGDISTKRWVLLATPRSGSTTMAALLFRYLKAKHACDGFLHEFFDPFYFTCHFEQPVLDRMLDGFLGAPADYHLESGPDRFHCEFCLHDGRIVAHPRAFAPSIDADTEVLRRIELLRETKYAYFLKSHAVELTCGMIDTLRDCGYRFATLRRSNTLDQVLSWGIAMTTNRWVADGSPGQQAPERHSLHYDRAAFDAILWQIQDYSEKRQYLGDCPELHYEMLARPDEAFDAMGFLDWRTYVPGPALAGLPVKINPSAEEKLVYFSNAKELLRWCEEVGIQTVARAD